MATSLKNGTCVSCGRHADSRDRLCPFCGELVWRPRWWRTGWWGTILLPPAFLACLTSLTRPDLSAAFHQFLDAPPAYVFPFAVGIGLLLLPAEDARVVVSSSSELRWRQTQTFFGGWVMGIYAIVGATAVSQAQPDAFTSAALLAGGLALATSAMPFFLHISWRSLAAAALLSGTITASRLVAN